MNLCGGGIGGISDDDLVIRIPVEEYSTSFARKKKSSSGTTTPSSSRRSKSISERSSSARRQTALGTRHSTSSHRSSGASMPPNLVSPSKSASGNTSMLNPVSRRDYEKQRTRQRGQSLRQVKTSSILMKKLDTGFNLTWINGATSTQIVNLSTNSDKSYLRIRFRSRDENESENDGSKGNQRDFKIRVRHIARVGSDAESGSDHRNGEHEQTRMFKNKRFFLKMRYNVGEISKFKFSAQSIAERDSVVLALRSLMDQGKVSQGSRPDPTPQSAEYDVRSDEVDLKNFRGLKINEYRKDPENSCGPLPNNHLVNPADKKKFLLESRDENGPERTGDSGRDKVTVFENPIEKRPFPRDSGVGKRHNSPAQKLTSPYNQSTITKMKQIKHNSRMEKNDVDDADRTSVKKNSVSSGKNRQYQGAPRVNQRSRSPRMTVRHRNKAESSRLKISTKEVATTSVLYESCSPVGCQPQTLAIVEDGDMATLAASCTNPVTGPWCTDDVCTASLRNFADSMTGIFDMKVNDNRNAKEMYVENGNQKAVAEEYISGFLNTNTNMSELLSVKELWNVAALRHATGKELKKRKLHNRARNRNGKATRFKDLRKQMTFKGGDTENSTFLQTTGSFDDAGGKASTGDCEVLYYDSDPEDARECNLRNSRRVAMDRQEKVSPNVRREALDILDTSRFGLGRKWKRLGKEVLFDIIEATKNEKLTLIWHPNQTKPNNDMAPVCVKVWVESGVYLADGTFLLPKLTWLPAHEKNLGSRVLNVSNNNPGSLELLDVCRVRECQSIDRSLHPFAHVDRSFMIQTQNGRYMFEAQSKQERGRVVNGLKLVIARLASLLMLKDLRAVDEFFGGNAVPGEAPVWARGSEKNESSADFHQP